MTAVFILRDKPKVSTLLDKDVNNMDYFHAMMRTDFFFFFFLATVFPVSPMITQS